jgi:prepilin-type N-terminal cleavage/methylation domain-containing protein
LSHQLAIAVRMMRLRSLLMRSRTVRRTGFTLVELLAVSAAVSLLGTQIFPLIGQSREAARRSQCKNNLKQIGLAIHNYHDTYVGFPVGWVGVDLESKEPDVRGMNGWGWGARITPFMDQAPLFNQLNFSARVDDPENTKSIAIPIPTLRCPADPFVKKTWKITDADDKPLLDLATANYVASFGTEELSRCEGMKPGELCRGDGLFFHNSMVRIREITDGTSNTIAVGERLGDDKSDHLSTWSGVIAKGKHPFARILGSSHAALDAKDRHPSDYGSAHGKGSHFVLTDGAVRFVSSSLDLKTFQALTTKAGAEVVDANALQDPATEKGAKKGTQKAKTPAPRQPVQPKAVVPPAAETQ